MKHDQNIKVSFCIPTYKRPVLLKEALDSVLQLEGLNEIKYEIIISDDGPNDELKIILDSYPYKNQIIRYIKNEIHGQFENLNNLVRNASYDWIVFLHDDDKLKKDYLIKLIDSGFLHSNNKVDLIWTGRQLTNSAGKTITTLKAPKTQNSIYVRLAARDFFDAMLFENNYNAHGLTIAPMVTGLTIRKNLIEKAGYFDSDLKISGDYLFIFKVIYLGSNIGYIDKPLIEYRVVDDSERAKPSRDGSVYSETKKRVELVLSFIQKYETLDRKDIDRCWKSFYISSLNINGPIIWIALYFSGSYKIRVAMQLRIFIVSIKQIPNLIFNPKVWVALFVSMLPQRILKLLNAFYYRHFLKVNP